MKIEIKKVTIEQEIFIAEDGTEFFMEDSCEAYEISLKEKSIKCYDRRFEKTNVESCEYVKLDDSKAVDLLIEICRWHGIGVKGLDAPGIYAFDNHDGWINISIIYEKLMEVDT